MARYARTPNQEIARATAAMGGAYVGEAEDDGDGNYEDGFAMPVAEGAGTFWLHPNYGVIVTAGSMLTLEGQLRFALSPVVDLGIVHGAGLGLLVGGGEATVMTNLDIGVFSQFNVALDQFVLLSARYVHGDTFITNDPTPGDVRARHNIGGGVGWMGHFAGWLDVSVEVLIAGIVPADSMDQRSFVIMPVLTLGAAPGAVPSVVVTE